MNILYIAQFHETCGYSHAAIGYLKSIDSIIDKHPNINLKILSLALDPKKLSPEYHEDKTPKSVLSLLDKYAFNNQEEYDDFVRQSYRCVWHMTSCLPLIAKKVNIPKGNFFNNIESNIETAIRSATDNYHILAWETDQLPREYIEAIRAFEPKQVIAPSTWNRDVFRKHFDSEYLPHLIETSKKEVKEIKLPNGHENKFKILSVSEWTSRKNFACLVKSFLSEFATTEDAMLIIKTNLPNGMKKENFLREFQSIKNSVRVTGTPQQNVVVILDYLSKEKMSFLYETCSVFCITSYGEGFSLPTSEAVTAGKPVICPKVGGHTDYIGKENPFFIDGCWDTVFDSPPYDNDGNWFVPTVKSTREKMRLAYEDFKDKKSLINASVRENESRLNSGEFSESNIGEKFVSLVCGDTETPKSKIELIKKKFLNLTLEEKIKELQNSYKGKECYILSCGPSLKDYDTEKLNKFLSDKLVFTVKQAYDLYSEVSDFHFFNCSNLPKRKSPFEAHYTVKKDCITVASSNYPESTRWPASQLSDIFFKIPIRTEINNEFLVRTGKIDEFLLKNNLTRPCGPGIMYETVLFMALHLGVKSITCIGWDLTKEKVNESNYQHFYGSSEGLTNRGDILDWEIEETRNFSKNFFEWCNSNNVELKLASSRSSLYEKIPRVKLEI